LETFPPTLQRYPSFSTIFDVPFAAKTQLNFSNDISSVLPTTFNHNNGIFIFHTRFGAIIIDTKLYKAPGANMANLRFGNVSNFF
jgi:hypothetical protein